MSVSGKYSSQKSIAVFETKIELDLHADVHEVSDQRLLYMIKIDH